MRMWVTNFNTSTDKKNRSVYPDAKCDMRYTYRNGSGECGGANTTVPLNTSSDSPEIYKVCKCMYQKRIG